MRHKDALLLWQNCAQLISLCVSLVFLAQLGKLQADMEAQREKMESTIRSTREELYSAQEEVPLLTSASDIS